MGLLLLGTSGFLFWSYRQMKWETDFFSLFVILLKIENVKKELMNALGHVPAP